MKLPTSSLSFFYLLAALGTSAPTPSPSGGDDLLQINVFRDRSQKIGSLPKSITLPSSDSKSTYFAVFKARLPAATPDEDYLTDWVLLSAQYSYTNKEAQLVPTGELYLGHAFFEDRRWQSEVRIFRGREAAELISSVLSYQPVSYSTDPWLPYVASKVLTMGLPVKEFDGKLAWADRAVDFITYSVT